MADSFHQEVLANFKSDTEVKQGNFLHFKGFQLLQTGYPDQNSH